MTGTVLVVDDSATMRQLVTATLQAAGWRVVAAANGIEALAEAERHTIVMVVTDWNMPEMNGLELVRSLRARVEFAPVPILVLTTESDDASKNAARAAGATGWLNKPLDAVTLTQIAESLLGAPGARA